MSGWTGRIEVVLGVLLIVTIFAALRQSWRASVTCDEQLQANTDPNRRRHFWLRAVLILLCIGVAGAALVWSSGSLGGWVREDVFLFLAFLPSAVGLLYFAASQCPRLEAVETTLRSYSKKAQQAPRVLIPAEVSKRNQGDWESNYLVDLSTIRDPISSVVLQTLAGAFALAGVLVAVALFSTRTSGTDRGNPATSGTPPAATRTATTAAIPRAAQNATIGYSSPPSPPAAASAGEPTALLSLAGPAATPAVVSATPEPGAVSRSPGPADAETDMSENEDKHDGERGLQFAAYGSYVFILLNMIHRINAGWLAGKFMLTGALRVAIAMVLGYAAQRIGIFNFIASEQQPFMFFAIGLFPDWSLLALRKRVSDALHPPTEADRRLPTSLVDGLDERTTSRLEEVGIWDLQHLANYDPRELVIATLLPIRRVLDWIDQAILIQSVGEKITTFREFGVRGAIDFAALYGRTFESSAAGLNAKACLDELVRTIDWHDAALRNLAQNLAEDGQVDMIWRMWQLQESDAPKL